MSSGSAFSSSGEAGSSKAAGTKHTDFKPVTGLYNLDGKDINIELLKRFLMAEKKCLNHNSKIFRKLEEFRRGIEIPAGFYEWN